MKNVSITTLTIALLAVCLFPLSAHGMSWSTTNNESLAHGTDYTWKVDKGTWGIPEGEKIVKAYLDIASLNNWLEPEDDYMNIYLLDNTSSNTNNYAGWARKTLLTTYEDNNWTQETTVVEHHSGHRTWYTSVTTTLNPAEDFHYELTGAQLASLTTYLSDDRFALGFDPNCHYSDLGISFTVETERTSVPEPASLLLLGLGFAGLAGIRRRFAK